MIDHGPRLERNFSVVDKQLLNDFRLSLQARGLLVHLLAKPKDWRVSVRALHAEMNAFGKGPGRDAIYSALNELIEFGYATRVLKGRFGGDYLIRSVPSKPRSIFPEKPEGSSPKQALIFPEKPEGCEPGKTAFSPQTTVIGQEANTQNQLVTDDCAKNDRIVTENPTLLRTVLKKKDNQEQRGARARRAPAPERVEVPLPADFAPTDRHRDFAARNGLNIDNELFAFSGNAEEKGRTSSAWNGAFATWLKRSVDFRAERRPSVGTPRHGLTSDGSDWERVKAENERRQGAAA